MRTTYLLAFWGLACGISWLIWLPLWWPSLEMPVLPYHHAWGAVGPFAAALILTFAERGSKGLNPFLRSAFRWRVSWIWYVVALGVPFLLMVGSLWADQLWGKNPIEWTGVGISREFPELGLFGFLLYNVLSFGIGEEIGWRGYALPRLQTGFSAFTASLVLTLGWAMWHLPLFFYRPGYVGMDFFGIIGWVFSLLTGSILLTWLYNSTRGSVWICVLFHASIDIAFTSDLVRPEVMYYLGALVTLWGIVILIVTKPVNLSRLPRFTVNHLYHELEL